jgi:DNA-directed RNA polymerase delta subunit
MDQTTQKNPIQNETAQVSFSKVLVEIMSDFPKRSQEIIMGRWGISGPKAMTLEGIGRKYGITRERVRQVIREVLKKMKEKKSHPLFVQIKERVVLAIAENDGIMDKKSIIEKLGKNNKEEQATVSFFLESMDGIQPHEIKGEIISSYCVPQFSITEWKKVISAAKLALGSKKKPLDLPELFSETQKNLSNVDLTPKKLLNFISVSEQIKKNNFEKWGLADWKEISPKGTREKAYLVLKETQSPLHFREIAKKIDEYHLNRKKTHPQTVHNELIKDRNFVLVGRGIYALTEWGYKKGTVKDVIEEIIKNSGSELGREELVSKVLDIRQVKKSTIVINLNNYFSKSKEGKYSIKK